MNQNPQVSGVNPVPTSPGKERKVSESENGISVAGYEPEAHRSGSVAGSYSADQAHTGDPTASSLLEPNSTPIVSDMRRRHDQKMARKAKAKAKANAKVLAARGPLPAVPASMSNCTPVSTSLEQITRNPVNNSTEELKGAATAIRNHINEWMDEADKAKDQEKLKKMANNGPGREEQATRKRLLDKAKVFEKHFEAVQNELEKRGEHVDA